MTTSVLGRVPVEQITERARSARPGLTLLTLLGGLLFSVGWVSARMFTVSWLCAAWCGSAVAEGWAASKGPSRAAQIEGLLAEREALRDQVRRLVGHRQHSE